MTATALINPPLCPGLGAGGWLGKESFHLGGMKRPDLRVGAGGGGQFYYCNAGAVEGSWTFGLQRNVSLGLNGVQTHSSQARV